MTYNSGNIPQISTIWPRGGDKKYSSIRKVADANIMFITSKSVILITLLINHTTNPVIIKILIFLVILYHVHCLVHMIFQHIS